MQLYAHQLFGPDKHSADFLDSSIFVAIQQPSKAFIRLEITLVPKARHLRMDTWDNLTRF